MNTLVGVLNKVLPFRRKLSKKENTPPLIETQAQPPTPRTPRTPRNTTVCERYNRRTLNEFYGQIEASFREHILRDSDNHEIFLKYCFMKGVEAYMLLLYDVHHYMNCETSRDRKIIASIILDTYFSFSFSSTTVELNIGTEELRNLRDSISDNNVQLTYECLNFLEEALTDRLMQIFTEFLNSDLYIERKMMGGVIRKSKTF
ncbi:GONST5 [Acrasis kona]|uniref:GONST5 n=1 Tax=Acrasis kona TaxID=1008807 RepID=A0AAW2YNR7_9EUKA